MTILQASELPTLSLLYKLQKLSPAAPTAHPPRTLLGPSALPTASKSLNDRVALFRGDITTLGIAAIVNAANKSLLGGGGVDGAIHRAAGPSLVAECRRLRGCETGDAKITDGYNLPARKVIHAVGPVYDDDARDQSERLLTSCYIKSLRLAAENGCESVAFSALSTGVYGYPSREAAPAALSAIRKFLTEEDAEGKVEKVVVVTFEKKDVNAYGEFIPLFFPPVPEDEPTSASHTGTTGAETEDNAKLDAEARAVASELPNAPTKEPSDEEHVDKKPRHEYEGGHSKG